VIATVFFFGSSLWNHIDGKLESSIYSSRGFYGELRLFEGTNESEDDYRSLFHGDQYLNGDLRYEPTSYYRKYSVVGIAINNHPIKGSDNEPLTVGVIGLGAGANAAYGEKGDQFYFYEINPQIDFIANHYFSYLKDSKASNHIVLGDGRLSLANDLKKNGSRQFDVLVVDAFSGDAVLIHLLTVEAFELYWKHIKLGGILAIHITNLYVELSDPVRQLAQRANKEAILIASDSEGYSEWVLLTSNKQFIEDKDVVNYQSEWTFPPKPIIWTDDFSNLFDVVR
jgi:spermidine synthase